MSEIASAYVTLMPSAQGFGAATQAQIAPELAKSGTKIGSLFGSAIKGSALAVTAGAGALLGAALVKGFNRLEAIDQANAKLLGLGNSANKVDKIMRNALASVRGTAFGLGDASTVAASAVAAGIKPGKDLRNTLKLVADSASIAGTDLASMGAIFNKVAASNKLQGDSIAQLSDQGIPIVALLAKQLNLSADSVVALASAGKINFATFQKAMESGLGGAALKSGNTFSGALANVGASLSRIGAGLIGGVFPYLAPAFQGITDALEPLEGNAASLGEIIGSKLGPALANIGPFISKAISTISGLNFSSLGSNIGAIRDGLVGLFSSSSVSGGGGIADSLASIGQSIKGIDFSQLKEAFGEGIADSVSVFSVLIGFAADHVDELAKALPFLISAYALYKTAQATANVLAIAEIPLRAAQIFSNLALARANGQLAVQLGITNGVERTGTLSRIAGTASTAASTVATIAKSFAEKAAAVASRAFAAAQFLLNAALTANPIGLIIVGLVALAAGLVLAYKRSDTFRAIVDGAFKAIKKTITAVINFVVPFVKNHWQLLLAIIGGPLGIIVGLVIRNFGTIRSTVSGAVNFVVNSAKKFGQFASAVGKHVSDAVQFFKDLPGKIKAFLSGLPGELKTIGGNIIDGLKNGIAAAGQRVLDAVRNIIDKIPKFIREKMGIASPSKITTILGSYIGDGLAKGIASSEKKITKAVGKVLDAAKTKLSQRIEDFKSLASGVGDNLTGDLFGSFETAGDFVKNLTTVKGNLGSTIADFKTLKGFGLPPSFLARLFADGGFPLIHSLAQDQGQAASAASLFSDINSLSGQLGNSVAVNSDIGGGYTLADLNATLKEINKNLQKVPDGVAKGVNGAATGGKNRGNKGGGKK